MDLQDHVRSLCEARLTAAGIAHGEHDDLRCDICQAVAPFARRIQELEQQAQGVEADHEREMLQMIDERDGAAEWADRLAYSIGSIEHIGEHSNMNDPWLNAYELATSIDDVNDLLHTQWHLQRALDIAIAADSEPQTLVYARFPWRVHQLGSTTEQRFSSYEEAARFAAHQVQERAGEVPTLRRTWDLMAQARRYGGLPDSSGGEWVIEDQRMPLDVLDANLASPEP